MELNKDKRPLSLEESVQLLMDERDIRACLYRFNRAGDRRDMDLWASCFHENAVDHHAPFWNGTFEEKRDGIYEGMNLIEFSQYNTGTINIELDGDVAFVESYVWSAKKLVHRSDDGHPLVRISGMRYIDRFERRDGVWRIAERWFVPEWGFFQEVPTLTKAVGPFQPPADQVLKQIPSKYGEEDISYHLRERPALEQDLVTDQ